MWYMAGSWACSMCLLVTIRTTSSYQVDINTQGHSRLLAAFILVRSAHPPRHFTSSWPRAAKPRVTGLAGCQLIVMLAFVALALAVVASAVSCDLSYLSAGGTVRYVSM